MVSRSKPANDTPTGPTSEPVEAEVVEPTETDGAATGKEIEAFRASLAEQPGLQSMLDWCVERSAVDEVDQWRVMESEVARILAGEDAATVLSESKPLSGKVFVGRPFRIDGFTLQPTDFSEGFPFYANINATIDPDGTTAVINCGGPKVIASLMRLEQLDAIPAFAMLKGTKTRRGFTVLDLVMPGPA